MPVVNLKVLEHLGATNARLKEVLTAEHAEDYRKVAVADRDKMRADVRARKLMEDRVRSRVEDGIKQSLRHYDIFQAVDLAMDSNPINKFTLPLMLLAQGKIDIKSCYDTLQTSCGCSSTKLSNMVRKSDTGVPLEINLPNFFACNLNIVKSGVRRRLVAQSNKYSNLWPYYNFESYYPDPVSKLQADAMSQVADMITDGYGLREHEVQCMRYGLMYGRCVDFVRCSWEREVQTRFINDKDPGMGTENFPVKQGISFFNPHPSRIFWDNAHPLSSVNSDTGCRWLGFWDIIRYDEIKTNPDYFNRESVSIHGTIWELYMAHGAYFNHYYTDRISSPVNKSRLGQENDRQSQVGTYDGLEEDASVFVATYYEKFIPADLGIGKYSQPVWVKLTACSDGTIIHGEFLPSRPAAYLGIDEDDNRQISPSLAMELLSFQDQMTNLTTQMLHLVQLESFTALGLNTDALDPETTTAITKHLKGKNWSGEPLVFPFSAERLNNLGVDVKNAVFEIKQAQVSTKVDTIFKAMLQLLNLMDRLLSMSPAEQGQPAPREISATEVVAIGNTTSSVYDAISNDIDSFRAAKKVIIYESFVNGWTGNLRVPVRRRYSKSVIQKAFPDMKDEQIEGLSDGVIRNDSHRLSIIGTPKDLVHAYVFSSRDGAERPSDAQAATVLVQFLSSVLQIPNVMEAIGKEKLFEVANEIVRMASGLNLGLEVNPGEDASLGGDQAIQQITQVVTQLQEAMGQIGEMINVMSKELDEQSKTNEDQQQQLQALQGLQQILQQLEGRLGNVESKQATPPPQIPYKDAPPEIRRQIEGANGFLPAPPASDIMLPEGAMLPDQIT